MTAVNNIISGTAETISESDQNYRKVLSALYVDLAERSFSYLTESGGTDKGFPFSYTNEHGTFSLGIVFAPDLASATSQISQFNEVVTSRAFESENDNHQITGFMTKEMMISRLNQAAVELPLLNYTENN